MNSMITKMTLLSISRVIALKRREKRHKINITWEKILLIIVIIVLFPEFHDQMYLARSRSTRLEIFLNSEGMSYQLGEAISKKELRQLANGPEGWDCSGGMNKWALWSGISRGEGFFADYTTEREAKNIYVIYLKRISNCFFSLPRVVEVDFRAYNFKLYEIVSGMSREEAEACLEKHGYKKWEGEYWKDAVSIKISHGSIGGVYEIKVRWYSFWEYEKMLRHYEKEQKN